jgi:Ca2+-binding EF-hand superfamily protein
MASQFEQGPGTKRLVHVQQTFERFAQGKPGDRSMNQIKFQMFCEEMGMVNPEMTRRLFLAMDDDNTGAMESTEFLNGLRLMCDESGGAPWMKKRIEFAFNLFDLDREKTVDQAEIKSFLKTFYTEARNMVVGWIGQFEASFGKDVAVVAKGGAAGKVRWNDDPALQRALKALEDKMERERELMSEAALNFRESKEENGIRLEGFQKWCTTDNDAIRLRLLDWLRRPPAPPTLPRSLVPSSRSRRIRVCCGSSRPSRWSRSKRVLASLRATGR